MPPERWYFKTYWLIVGFLCVGPFMLPLVWLNPRYGRGKKTLMTIIVLVASYFIGMVLLDSITSIMTYYQFMFDQLENSGN